MLMPYWLIIWAPDGQVIEILFQLSLKSLGKKKMAFCAEER